MGNSKYEDLRLLDELRAKGSITEEEYQREKAKVLNDESYNTSPINDTFREPLFGMSENMYLMLMHLSQLAGFLIPGIGFIVPVLLWIANKDKNPNVNRHGKNIVNFMISYLIYLAIATVLIILLIGLPALAILGILVIVFPIVGAWKAYNNIYWKYPFVIDFIK